ncbi:MAG: VanZ family protein [Ruminococcaceae bacterium]|nr:VanZ family protein [Oscillospiraceae bacterium]
MSTHYMTKKEKQVLLLRILLGVLIVCNMAVIFLFSSQSAKKSAAISQKVTNAVVETVTKDYGEKPAGEQNAIVRKAHTPIRKLAHMLEFGSLATLSFLFLITWRGKILWRYAASLGFALVYAATDELHQLFSDGRGARLSDVFIDFSGAFIACTLALIIVMLVRRIKKSATADSSATEQKPTFVVFVSQMFSRFQFFVSGQISKLKEVHKKKEKEK